MATRKRYSPEVRERAVRLVFEHQHEHASQWATIESISSKFGMTPQTLYSWVRQAERGHGAPVGVDDGGTTAAQGVGAREPGVATRE